MTVWIPLMIVILAGIGVAKALSEILATIPKQDEFPPHDDPPEESE